MRERLTYANVMATIAVFAALGGSAYAALKITGKNVVNGSLTGKDIKKRSVQLNRLRGKLPPGKRGAVGATGASGTPGSPGAQGPTGPAGPVDPSQFVPSAGTWAVSIGPSAWETGSGPLVKNATEAASHVGIRLSRLALLPSCSTRLCQRPSRARPRR